MPSNNEILKLEKLIISKLSNSNVEIILNGFYKNFLINNICHIPLYKKSYIIKNNKVNISPCYTHSNIDNIKQFTNIAII
jgi:hypothetical protein